MECVSGWGCDKHKLGLIQLNFFQVCLESDSFPDILTSAPFVFTDNSIGDWQATN